METGGAAISELEELAEAVSTPGSVRDVDAPPRQIRVQCQFSGGFGDWLIRHRVGLVFSTYQTGHLVFIGARADGMPVTSAAGFSRAMGIAAFSQRIYVGTKSEIWRLENLLGADELDNDMFDRLYVPRNAQVTGDINIHELGIEPNGRILFVNTRYSCLATTSSTHAFKPIWKPRFISRLAPEDRCHLNGLATENGRAHFLTACSTGDSVESWRNGQRDGGVLIDVETDEIIVDRLSMPHSPRVRPDGIYLVESGRGMLIRINRQTMRREDICFCPGFARGLAFVDRYAIVTLSLPRSAFGSLPIAENMKVRGANAWRGLIIIDTATGDVVEWLRLFGDVKELFDVAAIGNVRAPRGMGSGSLNTQEAVRWER